MINGIHRGQNFSKGLDVQAKQLQLNPGIRNKILSAILVQASLLLMAGASNSSVLMPVAASILLAAISLLGICYTRKERLEEFVRIYDLPENINVTMTRELADKIALPFENLFNKQIEGLLADPQEQTITAPVDTSEESSLRVNDLTMEETLLPMLGEIKKGELEFDINQFPEQFTQRVAEKMKETYFAKQPITVEEIKTNINKIKIQGRTLGRNVAVWIQKHKLAVPAKKLDFGGVADSQAAKRRG